MNHLFLNRSRRNLAAAALVVFAVATSACSGASSSTGVSLLSNQPSVKRTTHNYNFTTINAGTDTQVFGIDKNGDIVGAYHSGNSTFSFISQPSDYFNYIHTDYPDASNGTVLRSIAVGKYGTVEAGYAIQPGGGAGNSEAGTYPAVDNAGLWSLVGLDQVTGSLHYCQNNQLWGINDSGEAVGYREVYQNMTTHICLIKAYKVAPGANFSNIDLPMGWNVHTSQAAGIDDNNDWVGSFSVSASGSSSCSALFCGWYRLAGSGGYGSFSDGGGSTYALGISDSTNDSNDVVGVYTDSQGSKGFLYQIGTGFQSINVPAQWTNWGVTGINDSGVICGWYQDASGTSAPMYGFVGSPYQRKARH